MSNLPAFLVGAMASNAHVQQMARALHEAGALARYVTGGVDRFSNPLANLSVGAVRRVVPGLDRQLKRRAVAEVPAALVESRWRWELPRVAASRLGALGLEDWCWERGDLDLDRHCARGLERHAVGGFLGIEHGALASLRTAKARGQTGVVAFLSPHRRTRIACVDAEYERQPELRTPGRAAIDALSSRRDLRRDEEAATADWVVTNSSFTTRSLVDAGVDPGKVLTLPLGGPEPVAEASLPVAVPSGLQCVCVGGVSVQKGAHYLLRAWRRVAGPGTELHFYGQQRLPASIVDEARAARGGDRIVFHGSIPSADLAAVYQRASVLVFPTLCDGFGLVASEALANGLPVITTHHAGAADAIEDGRSGFVIEPANEDALARALAWCRDHPRELLAMRRPALASARRWTWTDYRQAFRAELSAAIRSGIGPSDRVERGERRAR